MPRSAIAFATSVVPYCSQSASAWSDAAASVLGADARETHAIRADGDTLVVTVPSAHWAGELRLRERELLAAVKLRAPASGIARVRAVPAATPPR